MESPAPCHLRPSDKKRLAAIDAAKRAAADQRVIKQRIKLLQVGYDLDSVHVWNCVVLWSKIFRIVVYEIHIQFVIHIKFY